MLIIISTIGTELQILGQLRHLIAKWNNLLHGYEPGLKKRVVGEYVGKVAFSLDTVEGCIVMNSIWLNYQKQLGSTRSSES